jgi:hypothetical protein
MGKSERFEFHKYSSIYVYYVKEEKEGGRNLPSVQEDFCKFWD